MRSLAYNILIVTLFVNTYIRCWKKFFVIEFNINVTIIYQIELDSNRIISWKVIEINYDLNQKLKQKKVYMLIICSDFFTAFKMQATNVCIIILRVFQISFHSQNPFFSSPRRYCAEIWDIFVFIIISTHNFWKSMKRQLLTFLVRTGITFVNHTRSNHG